MNSNLQLLYKSTLTKYKKFKSRFDKNVSSGHFYELSHKAQHQIISRLERLKRRLSDLKTQLKLALVSGALVICLSTTSQAQQLGPFVQNDEKNPIRNTRISGQDKKLTFGDLDNDGDLDLAMGLLGGNIAFYENIGDQFSPRFAVRTGSYNPFDAITVPSQAAPELVDLDGDGDLDLILGQFDGYSSYGVFYYENNDFDDDGIIGNTPAFSLVTSPGSPIDNVSASKYQVKTSVADIDGDGDLDIFIGQNGGFPSYESMLFFENNAGFSKQPLPAGLVEFGFDTGSSRTAATFVDYDNDGDTDLFIGSSDGTIRVFKNTDIDPSDPADVTIGDDISFTELTGALNPFVGIDVGVNSVISFTDLDADSDLDAVIGQNSTSAPFYFKNNNGTFTQVYGIDNPFDYVDFGLDIAPTTVDLDGDTFLDIVIGEKYGKSLFHFRNNGDGSFSEEAPIPSILDPGEARPSPAFGDIDNDGDQDLFVSVYQGAYFPYLSKVKFFSNDGSGNFSNQVASPIAREEAYKRYGLTINDFDGDKDLDAIIGISNNDGSFVFSRNDGTISAPTFNDQPTSGAPFGNVDLTPGFTSYMKPVMVDLNHDGEMDVVTGIHSSSLSGQLAFFRNNGFGNLFQQTSAANPFNGLDVGYDSHPAFLDIDNDGDLDVIVGNGAGQITFFENQNEPPQVTAGATPLTYTEGDAPLSVHPTLDISDDDSDLISGATVKIQNYVAGEDVLTIDPITNPDWNISATFVTIGLDAGTLVITGLDTIMNYRTVLQSVKYQNTSVNPNTVTRNIQFAVTDFDNTDPFSDAFPEPIIGVNIIANNSTPTVSTSATAAAVYTENTTPGVIIDAAVTVSDIDNTSFQSATISITNNFNQTEDALVFSTQNGITGNYVSTTGILTLSGTSSVANYQTALRSVRYINNSEDPSTATRTIEFSVFDGTDNSAPATRTVQVVAVNDAPVLSSSSSGTLNYDQNTAAILVDDMLSITDVDNANIQSVTVTINGYQSGDVLSATPPAGITSNFDTGTGILSLSGSAPIADYITAAVTTSFSSSGTGTRQIDFLANDGTDNSNLYSRQVSIIVNVAPVLSSNNAGTGINYTQNKAAVVVDNQLVISDTDDTNLESVSISITSYQSGDLLTITPPPATTSNFDNGNGILTVSGSATLAEYQTAIRTVAFSSSNGAGSRTIAFIGNDGDDDSNTYNRQITISNPSTIPPVVNTTPGTTQVGSTIVIDLCNIISDPNNTFDELTIIVVSILSQASTNVNACDLTIDYSAVDFEGQDSIVLRATDPDGNTAENTLTITVEPIDNGEPPILPLEVYSAVSPNGDGLNDTWRIKNLLQTPNSIKLFNRWGDLVKTINDYIDPGDSGDEIYIDLSGVPAGTYFYSIESVNGKYTGYITIKK